LSDTATAVYINVSLYCVMHQSPGQIYYELDSKVGLMAGLRVIQASIY